MPFTPTPKPGFSRLFAFVDQFNANDPALRSEFDTFNADLDQSINDMIDYFEAAKNDATDQRFLGLSGNPPGTRNDHTLLNPSPLQEGDFYISIDSGDFGTFYFFKGGTWEALSGAAFSVFFLTLIGAADAAELRGLLGLGSAATSAAAAFATAAQGLKADSALQVPNLLANTVTDWDAVSTSKTGFYQSASGATNSPYSGDSFSAIYIARTATSGALIMIGNTSNRLFMRQYNTAWAEYREVSVRTTGQSGNLDNLGVGVIAVRFDDTATGAPSGYGTYNGLCEHYGSDTIRRQIVTIDGQDAFLVRTHDGSSWGAWLNLNRPSRHMSKQSAAGTSIDFTGIPVGTEEVVIMFDGVMTNGTTDLIVQIGDNGGFETTGYASSSSDPANNSSSTAGFVIRHTTTVDAHSGMMRLSLMDSASFQWVQTHGMTRNSVSGIAGGGAKSLSEELTQIRVTTVGGNTFNAGTINISYR